MPILRAKDTNKDQTYFLWQVKKEQLPYILMPVGEFDNKSLVRDYAQSKGLITSDKPDSQGLCFVGQTSLRAMLISVFGIQKGNIQTHLSLSQAQEISFKLISKNIGKKIKDIEPNEILTIRLGQHDGAFLFTIGQRQNLGISNGPWLVSHIDTTTNMVTVCHQKYASKIAVFFIEVKDLNWQVDILDSVFDCQCQIRYRNTAIDCTVDFDIISNTAKVQFKTPASAVAVGQSAVFYYGNTLLGGGFISSVG